MPLTSDEEKQLKRLLAKKFEDNPSNMHGKSVMLLGETLLSQAAKVCGVDNPMIKLVSYRFRDDSRVVLEPSGDRKVVPGDRRLEIAIELVNSDKPWQSNHTTLSLLIER